MNAPLHPLNLLSLRQPCRSTRFPLSVWTVSPAQVGQSTNLAKGWVGLVRLQLALSRQGWRRDRRGAGCRIERPPITHGSPREGEEFNDVMSTDRFPLASRHYRLLSRLRQAGNDPSCSQPWIKGFSPRPSPYPRTPGGIPPSLPNYTALPSKSKGFNFKRLAFWPTQRSRALRPVHHA